MPVLNREDAADVEDQITLDLLSIRRPKTWSTEAVIRRKIRFLFSFWHGQLSQGSQRAKAYLCWYYDYAEPGSAV